MNSDFGFQQKAPSLLILTVGTGTAGKRSDVAQGLANTIRQVQPRKFWLVPSASEKSIPVADLIRETVADLESFAPWSASAAYHAIANHDDIHGCRRFVKLAEADELARPAAPIADPQPDDLRPWERTSGRSADTSRCWEPEEPAARAFTGRH